MTSIGYRAIHVLGADPGPTTGIVVLSWYSLALAKPPYTRAYQVNADAAPALLEWILATHTGGDAWTSGGIEAYVRGNRSSRTKKADDSGVTIKLVHTLTGIASGHGLDLGARSASTVKTWATDKRMKAAGLEDLIPKKMLDAWSAGQHGLFSACSDSGIGDPLGWARRKTAL
jgi:hypothetical protein